MDVLTDYETDINVKRGGMPAKNELIELLNQLNQKDLENILDMSLNLFDFQHRDEQALKFSGGSHR